MGSAAKELLLDQNWRALGSCATTDANLWFAVGAREHKEAKKICRSCPVRTECLSYAMDAPVDHGVWGGFTERERRRFRRQAGDAGWRAHLDIAS
ncbi:MAG TPA: WhiB family transcriptional regulator [Actinomycetota bacterium]|jgi:WhiB family transcriptional regulator, redox-sensing transcriptional regulator|nr:WhiB family transcriptional regulator [Actinomycetota bacterium]